MKEMKNALKFLHTLVAEWIAWLPSYAGVAGSSPTEKEQKFVPFSFIHNSPPPYLDLTLGLSSEYKDKEN